MRLPGRLEQSLTTWLPRQRWFAGKGRGVVQVEILTDTELVPGDPGLHHVILGVRQGEVLDHYQVLLGVRGELPGRLEYAEIHPAAERPHDPLVYDPHAYAQTHEPQAHEPQADEPQAHEPHVYDAVHDPELTRVLLARLAGGARVGALSFHTAPGARVETALVSLASPAEQSNTSLIFGETYICKLFRRLTPGLNPDLELNLGLSEVGCGAIPELYGWIDMSLDGEPTTLAMLSQFLSSATDGWRLATTSVRDLYAHASDRPEVRADEVGGDFAAEAERLGVATAAVHRDLARAFEVTELSADEVRATGRLMHERFVEARLAVPDLAPYTDLVTAAYDDLVKHTGPVAVQRIHGDYHLGQVMRTEHRWVLLDFEGEPARSLAERRAPGHPLRDVAGMLRSFEYAARFLLAGQHSLLGGQHSLLGGQHQIGPGSAERLELRAREWADRNRAAFCRGYVRAGGPDPEEHEVLLRAFEFDKAVYEVLYEARNRPSWLHIPLSGFAAHDRSRGR